ncbi:YdcF family protein [Acinetobacter qingfengensis]|uniref:DUF218 domain-containing protein n=1 Tax=Acinetobacter qingfengensis TaxID=1262585 RepID=A0A1E7RG06_9GAMM|nr:YdcF family protein [Acinetobacter qingfengensis]KAA8732695.1 YdcF family protein [Acinetobacter qingfengensis]OEY98192.1 hypothetical protein BJI46_01335 [Acinetobacter qingfengensis]
MSMISRSLLFILGTILFLNGFVLILMGKIHLGTILPLLIGIIFLCHGFTWSWLQTYLRSHPALRNFWCGIWILFFLWCITFFGFVMLVAQKISDHHRFIQPPKAIIVLGSGVQGDQPSPTLAKRLDTAATIAQQYSDIPIIVSGGLGFSEHYSEAEVMANYLHHQYQIPLQRIVQENQSTSTDLNFRNSQMILSRYQLDLSSPIAVVTSDFHTVRAAAIAKQQGYQHVEMISAPTPKATSFNVWLREYFAYISGWILNEY